MCPYTNVKCVPLIVSGDPSHPAGELEARCDFAFRGLCLNENCDHFHLHRFSEEVCEAFWCKEKVDPPPEPIYRRISLGELFG